MQYLCSRSAAHVYIQLQNAETIKLKCMLLRHCYALRCHSLTHTCSLHTLPISDGITAEFVAYPMPKVTAASLPTNLAVSFSSSSWTGVVPEAMKKARLTF